ncbi:hypothetical protein DPMN_110882 [Dreissena polymorpha]|uniref:Sodium channel protein n=1 Tax=Dreissena polymorpha TaxID=45954 RepID=A0A9D4KE09_DREPO|nr:hypothetical protein DPMN_110882 [Dreissena polymorpha]
MVNTYLQEKEKELKNKERKRKQKKKKEKERLAREAAAGAAANGLANGPDNHVSHPPPSNNNEDSYLQLHKETNNAGRPGVKINTNSTTRPLGNPNHANNGDPKPGINTDPKPGRRNPMVKMASKDSGTGNSVESSRSNGSKEGDLGNEGGSNNGSTIDILKSDSRIHPRKPFVKQASMGMVSSSGVNFDNKRGSVGDNDIDQGVFEDPSFSESPDGENGTKEKEGPGRKYIRETYPHITIIDVGNGNPEIEREPGQLINRNPLCCYDCCGGRLMVGWMWYQQVCFSIVSEPMFDLFIILCIVLNTLFMTMEHYPQTDTFTLTLSVANYFFSAVFILEAVLKLSALTKHYFKNKWNIFDLVIVAISILDMSVTSVDGLSVIRICRLLRVFKLAQSWPTMRLLLAIIMNTLGALGNLTLILLIVIYIFAVVGLQLFNDKYTDDKFEPGEIIRWHFKDIFHAFMMIFRVLCGEWIEPLWDCMRASDELCMVVFLPTLVIGNFIVLNLFLALLLSAFATDSIKGSDDEGDDENSKLKIAIQRIIHLFCCCFKKKSKAVNSVSPDIEEPDETERKETPTEGETKIIVTNGIDKKQSNGTAVKDIKTVDNAFTTKTKRDQFKDFNKAMDKSKEEKKEGSPENQPKEEKKKTTTDNKDSKPKDKAVVINEKDKEPDEEELAKKGIVLYKIPKKPKKEKKDSKDKNKVDSTLNNPSNSNKDADDMELGAEASTIPKDETEEEEKVKTIEIRTCWPLPCAKKFESKKWCACCWTHTDGEIYRKWFRVRVMMNMIVGHKVFEGFILLSIAISSITLAFEDVDLYKNQTTQDALFWLNIIFTVIFALEMLMKWVAFGFRKYFSSFWCWLDFGIVVISFASLIADALGGANLSAFRAMRTLRALRPLRAVSRWEGMRIVVNALIMAVPSIINVLLVCLVFWLIFAIMGVQFFSGKFWKCVDSTGEKVSKEIVKTKDDCNSTMYSWQNSKINFDHVGNAFLALFQIATFEGWMEVMVDAVDSAGIDEQPSFENSLYAYLFFIAFIVFGAFFTLNLIIGVVIDNFNQLKKKYDGSYLDLFLTSGQRQYYNTIKKLGNKKPQKTIRRPKNKVQSVFYDIAVSSKFDLCIVVVIFLNMIQMAVDHYGQTQAVTDVLSMLNILFVVIFTLESVVKIIGLRWHYFTQPWNIFDFSVVIVSLLGIILSDVMSNVPVSPTMLRVVRVFRIGRVLRLIRSAKGIRKLLFALIMSLPALLNIGMLLFLIMYIYTIICLSQFQNLMIQGAFNDDVVNFKTFANSFLLMFRLSTGAGWNDALNTLMVSEPSCNSTHFEREPGVWIESSGGNCGNSGLAIIVLTSYILILRLVVINMFIAVILENFNQAHEQESVGITEDDFEMFYSIWERYDPLATQFIKYEQLSNFVADLEPPLGIQKPNEIALVSFDLPIVEGDKLHCLDVLMALVKYVLGNVEETEEFLKLHTQMELKFQAAFPTRVNTTKKTTTMMRKKEDVAAKTLQRAWRSWKAQKQMKSIATLAMQQKNQSKSGLSIESRTKNSSIRSLGHRLSTALSSFFSSSRPSSAISQLSVKSSSPTVSGINTRDSIHRKAKSAMEMPKVTTLYGPERDQDIEL